MPFYRVTKGGSTRPLKAFLKRPDKNYHSKWSIKGFDGKRWDIVTHNELPQGTMGLFLSREIAIYRSFTSMPMIKLLVGDEILYFYEQVLELVDEKEIDDLLNTPDGQ